MGCEKQKQVEESFTPEVKTFDIDCSSIVTKDVLETICDYKVKSIDGPIIEEDGCEIVYQSAQGGVGLSIGTGGKVQYEQEKKDMSEHNVEINELNEVGQESLRFTTTFGPVSSTGIVFYKEDKVVILSTVVIGCSFDNLLKIAEIIEETI